MQHFEYYKIHQIVIQFAIVISIAGAGKAASRILHLHEKVSFLAFNARHFDLDK